MITVGNSIWLKWIKLEDIENLYQSKIKSLKLYGIIVLQIVCYYKCSVALPRGSMGLSAVCSCCIS